MNLQFIKIIPKKQLSEFIFIILLLIFSSLIEILGIGFIPIFVGFLVDPNFYLDKVDIYFVKNFFLNLSEKDLIIRSSFILCGIFIIKNLFLSFLVYFEGNFSRKMKISNSKKLFNEFIYSPYSFHLDKNPSIFVRSVTSDINESTNYIKNITLIIKEILILVFIFSLLVYADPRVTTSIFLTLGFLSFLFFFVIKNNLKKRGEDNLKLNSSILKISNQSFNAIKDVKLFSKESYLSDVFSKNFTNLEKNHLWNYFLSALPRFILEIFAIIGISGVILFLYFENNSIVESLPIITLMAVSTIRLIPSFNSITKSLSSMKYNQAAMLNVYSIFNVDNVKNLKSENKLKNVKNLDQLENIKFEKNIVLKDVFFKYQNNKKTILQNINLEIKKKSKIAIIGRSGSGKTTIVDIIIGLLEPTQGKLIIDGNVINDIKCTNWRNKIGYIPQNFYLFDESIKKNVAFGIKDHLIDDGKVKKALEFAQLGDFVNNLEEKIETKVGNQGIMLSGGQKQRIIIARAFYHDPEILILDEATSAIDEEVEKDFIDNLLEIGKNKTIIIISHRSSTIENCDEIFKVEDCKIIKKDEKKN